jgi:SAM-dependent methyltransferase
MKGFQKYQTPEKIALKFNAIGESSDFWQGKTVLDIGCNEGLLYPLLKECGISEYVGIDTSAEYIWQARQNFPEVEFLMVDLKTFPRYFDIGIALSTLHIFNNEEFEKILKKYSRQCNTFIFEVPVEGTASIYYTRSEKENIDIVVKYFKRVLCYGVSPSPHDPNSIRKVFKCEN